MAKEHFRVRAPTAGLNYQVPSTMLADEQTPACSEVRMGAGVVEKSLGTVAFAGTGSTPLNGTVMKLAYINSVLICHTTTKVYSLVSGAFADETDAGGPYTGTILTPISSMWMYVTGSAKNYYIFANGVDQPRKWDLTTAAVELLANTPTKIPDWIANFGGRLCMYSVTDGGDDFPKRVRWSAPNAPEDYTATSAGFADLYAQLADSDRIMRAEKMGVGMIVYGDHSIALQEYTQAADHPFAFYALIPNVGLAAPRALLNINNAEHFFLGWDDIYRYQSGAAQVERVGGNIREELFTIIDPDNIEASFMVYVGNENRVRLHIPQVGSSVPDVYFEYNLSERSWTRGARTYSGYGEYQVTTTETWDSDTGAWNNDPSSWDSATTIKGFPLSLYGDSAGKVYQYPAALYSLAGTAIPAYFDTKDFVGDERYRKNMKTWLSLEFEGRGNTVVASYSINGGNSYTTLSTVTMTDDFSVYRVDLDVTSTQIRFRFANSVANECFRLRWFEVGYVPGSEYYRS